MKPAPIRLRLRRPTRTGGLAAGLGVACLLAAVPGASAQSLLSVEIAPRFVMPVSTFGDQGAESTTAVTGAVFLRVFSGLSVYGGWDRTSFDCGPCSGSGALDVSGPFAGLEAQLSADRRVRPWFRAGFGRRTTESDIPTAVVETEKTWGIHLGLGIQVDVVERVALTTGARFETLDPSLELGSDATELGTPVSYASFELGIRLNAIP